MQIPEQLRHTCEQPSYQHMTIATFSIWHASLSIAIPGAGDSACSIPPQTIAQECLDVIRDWTPKIAKELKVVGLINIQYAIQDNQV